MNNKKEEDLIKVCHVFICRFILMLNLYSTQKTEPKLMNCLK